MRISGKLLLKLSSVIVVSGVAIVSFQNCSKNNFLQSQKFSSMAPPLNPVFKNRTLYGDMLINNSALTQPASGANQKAIGYATYGSQKWPNGKIYIDTETYKVDQELVIQLKEACRDWTTNSSAECVFVKSNEVDNPIYITSEPIGCWATLGYNEKDVRLSLTVHANQMNMIPGCFDRHSVLHEVGHVLGLIHEHQRFDRDDYIQVLDENIKPDRRFAWNKIGKELDIQNFNKKYDINSVMHYGQFTGDSIAYNKPGYIIKAGGKNPGFQKNLSDEDKTAIAEIYGYASAAQPVGQPPQPQRPVQPPQPQQPQDNQVKGGLDVITSDGRVLGWVCNNGIAKSIDFHVYGLDYVGGPEVFIAAGTANNLSEVQVAQACNVSSGNYRFDFKLPPSASNKLIRVYGISVSGDNKNLPIANSGVFRAPQLVEEIKPAQPQQPVEPQQPAQPQQPSQPVYTEYNQVKGHVDRITSDGVVEGWACNNGIAKSISIHVYGVDRIGGPELWLGGALADSYSEIQVAQACNVGSGYYRFNFKLPASAANKLINVYGITVSGDGKNLPLENSGAFRFSTSSFVGGENP